MAIEYSSKTIAELKTIVANCKRLNKTNAPVCLAAEEELKRRHPTLLEPAKSQAMIFMAAREDRCVSYGQVAEASGVPWSVARLAMPGHLWELISHAHNLGWPMLSAIVVNKPSVATGKMDPSTLKGFIAAAHSLGRDNIDANGEEFLKKEQQRVFDFAKGHPDL
jgi:hypothetical protein